MSNRINKCAFGVAEVIVLLVHIEPGRSTFFGVISIKILK
jgi:hypothetical protein